MAASSKIPPVSSGEGSWTHNDQEFIIHTVFFQAHGSPQKSTRTTILLDRSIVPLLPKNPISPQPPSDLLYKIASAGDKGEGMFATRDIPAGALILVEHPVIITPAILQNIHSLAYEALFAALDPLSRAELLTMTNCRSKEECSLEEGISRTNGTGVDLPVSSSTVSNPKANEYGAVFLKINRSNHSCGPNAAHKWDPSTLSSSLYALRPISAGEEITMIYTDVTAPRATRQSRLYSSYGFHCACPYCDLSSQDAISSSDLARAELRDWRHTHPGFLKWSKDMCREDDAVIRSHLEALRLIEKEGMHGLQCIFLEEIALCYAILGEEAEFRAWGERVVALCRVQDPELAADFTKWIANPKLIKLWGWRKKQRMQMRTGRRARNAPAPSSPEFPLLLF